MDIRLSPNMAHGQRPWPKAMTKGHGQKPWPKASATSHGQRPWPKAVAKGHGSLPWPRPGPQQRWSKAIANGPGAKARLQLRAQCNGEGLCFEINGEVDFLRSCPRAVTPHVHWYFSCNSRRHYRYIMIQLRSITKSSLKFSLE